MIQNLDDRDYCTLTRRARNIKLDIVAQYIGCSVSMLSQWERNKRNLSDGKVNLYLKFLNQYQYNK
jgi:transcriptional regulator with XRE-family HTH domain